MQVRGGAFSRTAAYAALACLVGLIAIPSAGAQEVETSKPLVSAYAWYWEQAEAKDIDGPQGTVTVDTNNENCPQLPGGGLGNVTEETCAEGRLPVRIVQGDYKEPNQLSAVMFDTLTSVPLGSKVESFTATFEEAKAGCREKETAPSGQQCETTEPVNVEGHELQACLVTELFGEGVARPYRELPRHECTDGDPVAKREKKGDTFFWTFDLTDFAQKWADGDVMASAIVITGAEPKNTGPQDSWRVTLLGPVDDGIEAVAKYVAPEIEILPETEDPIDPGTPGTPAIPGTPGTPGTPGSAGVPSSATAGSGGSAPSDGAAAAEPGEAKAPVDAAEETLAAEPTAAGASGPPGGGLPWYGWLALLGGLAAFSLVRSTVLEGAAGIRPNGVLAQIQKINAARRDGAAPAGAGEAGLWGAFLGMTAGVRSAAGAVGRKVSNLKAFDKAKGLAGKLRRTPGKGS